MSSPCCLFISRGRKIITYLKRKKICKALFPSTHQIVHSTVKVSRTESLKNLKKPTNHLDALTSLKHKEIGHPKVMGRNASINIEEQWCTESMAHARRQRVQCLLASRELNKWKDIHTLSHWSGLMVLTGVLHIISKRQKAGVTRKGENKNHRLQRTEMYPKPARVERFMIKQHSPSGSRQRDLLFIHPLAP